MDAILTFLQRSQGEDVANVMCWGNVPTNESALQDLADAIRVRYVSFVQADMVNTWFLDGIRFTFDPGPGQYSVELGFTSGPLQGSIASDPVPNQAALLVSTAYLGPRPNRGRIYFPGQAEGNLTAGLFTTATVEAFQDMVIDWAIDGIDYGSGASNLRIARRAADGSIVTSNPITSVVGRTIPAVQRRRRRVA